MWRSCHDSIKVGDSWNTLITSENVFDEDNMTVDLFSFFAELRLSASSFPFLSSRGTFLDG